MTGSRGFIGATLVRALRDAGTEVREFTSSSFLSRNGTLAEGVADCRAVVHLASRVNPKLAEDDPDRVDEDRHAFRLLLDGLASGPDHVVSVVLPSSGGTVYDPDDAPPYSEHSRCRPVTAYGRLRLEFEEMLASAPGPITPVALRISNVYGPGQRTGTGQGVVAHWMQAVRRDLPVQLIGDSSTRRDYVYIDDVVGAITLGIGALERGSMVPAAVNVGAGRPTSLQQLVDCLGAVVGHERLRLEYLPARTFDRGDTWLDVQLAADTLRWRPTTSLASGLAATWRAGGAESPGR